MNKKAKPNEIGDFLKIKSVVLGKRMKELRNMHGISCQTLSEELSIKFQIEVSEDSLSNYEYSESEYNSRFGKNLKMRLEVLIALAEYYGVSLDYLVGNSDISTPDLGVHEIIHETGISEENAIALLKATEGDPRIFRSFNLKPPQSYFTSEKYFSYCKNIRGFINHVLDAYREDKAIKKCFHILCEGIDYTDDANYLGLSSVDIKELVCDKIGAKIAAHLKRSNLSQHKDEEEIAIRNDEHGY